MVKSRELPRVSYLVKWVERGLRTRLDAALADSDVTTQEYTTLSVLYDRDGLSSAQLARRAFVTPQAMNQLVISLERRGLLERSPDENHSRILRARLSKRGRALVEQCDLATQHVEKQLLAGLSRSDVATLRHLLQGCAASLGAS